MNRKIIFAIIMVIDHVSARTPLPDAYVLKGTQVQESLTLVRAKKPHLIDGQYIVPKGSELIIDFGSELEFSKKSSLDVQGKLQVRGIRSSPVIFRGKTSGVGSWQGIKINRSESTKISFAQIKGAQTAIQVTASNPLIENSIITDNNTGIYIGDYGAASNPTIKNCLIFKNRSNGISLVGSNLTVDGCTILKNNGWGIWGEYYASPKITGSIITENRSGGISLRLYECNASARGSIIHKNGKLDVVNDSPMNWDFSGNWWGTYSTGVLLRKGDTAALRTVRGQVKLYDFLEKEPKNCGSTLEMP